MISHDVTIAGYLVAVAGIVLMQVLATRTRAPATPLSGPGSRLAFLNSRTH